MKDLNIFLYDSKKNRDYFHNQGVRSLYIPYMLSELG